LELIGSAIRKAQVEQYLECDPFLLWIRSEKTGSVTSLLDFGNSELNYFLLDFKNKFDLAIGKLHVWGT
jgi:hypothetical protein